MLFFMNEFEKQRQELLNHTRSIYNEKKQPPAIHPRYQHVYQSLYEEKKTSSFVFRLVIASAVFFIFFAVNYKRVDIGFVSSERIIKEVQKDLFGEKFPLFIKDFKLFKDL